MKNSKRFEKNVKEIVRKEIQEELEEKHAIAEYQNVGMYQILIKYLQAYY